MPIKELATSPAHSKCSVNDGCSLDFHNGIPLKCISDLISLCRTQRKNQSSQNSFQVHPPIHITESSSSMILCDPLKCSHLAQVVPWTWQAYLRTFALTVPASWTTLPPDSHMACSLITLKPHPNVTFSMRLSLTTLFKITTLWGPWSPSLLYRSPQQLSYGVLHFLFLLFFKWYTVHLLKVYNSMVFSIFTELWNHNHSQF